MTATLRFLPRTAALLAGAALTFLPASAQTETKDTFPTFESYIKVSGHAASISGNEASFSRRTRESAEGAAGIEDLHIYKDVNRTTTMVIDGRALAGAEDYLGSVLLVKEGQGSIEAGYRRFRTFYDGVGGFFPLNGAWFPLNPEDLHTDRGRFWAELKLNREGAPAITLRYTNETRTGQKDSTIWGETNRTGLPLVPTNNAQRKILPAYIDLNERHQILEGSIQHTVGNTTVNLRVIGDRVDNYDTRYFTVLLGETNNSGASTERSKYQADGIKADTISAIATTETVFNDKVTLNTGLSYRHLESDITGERPNAIGVAPTYDFKNLVAGSQADIYTANASLGLTLVKDLFIQPSVRYEDSYTKSSGTYTRVTGSAANPVNAFYQEDSRVKEQIVTPELSVRYTGFDRIVLYATGSDRIVRGDDRYTKPFTTLVPAVTALAQSDIDQDQARYTLGANWNPSTRLTLRTEVFHKDHENKFIGYANQLGQRYVIGYEFTGLKLSAIVKVTPTLSFTTRYQPQTGEMQVTTDSTAQFQSMDAESHLISETIDWNPHPTFYAQASVNVAYNYISTAYPVAGTSELKAPQRNADNNYVSGSLMSGFAVTKRDDVQVQFTWQRADNFEPELATGTQPYGAGYEEYAVTVGVKHKFSDRLLGHAKLGYISSDNDTTGGHTDFHGPLGYVSLEYGL